VVAVSGMTTMTAVTSVTSVTHRAMVHRTMTRVVMSVGVRRMIVPMCGVIVGHVVTGVIVRLR
jgi:hypothetical protein